MFEEECFGRVFAPVLRGECEAASSHIVPVEEITHEDHLGDVQHLARVEVRQGACTNAARQREKG